MTLLEAFTPFLVALLTSGTISSVLMWYLKRTDKVEALNKISDRQAEGIAVLTEGFLVLLEALHRSGIINGESEHVRKDIELYLLKNTKNGLYTRKDKEK